MPVTNIFSVLDILHNAFKLLKMNIFFSPVKRKTNIRESLPFMLKIAAFKSAAIHGAQTVKVVLVCSYAFGETDESFRQNPGNKYTM